ncbi:MAG: hypothetical protein KF729_30595 [Sandaracinaceae bacterium]|nr:hypothetical protein [Sandaracinaceae bacterium]
MRRRFALALGCLALGYLGCEPAMPLECVRGTPGRLPDGTPACIEADAGPSGAMDAGPLDDAGAPRDGALSDDGGAGSDAALDAALDASVADAGPFGDEVEEAPDAPDCVVATQCAGYRTSPRIDLRDDREEATFLGRIDGHAHVVRAVACGRDVEVGDRDVFFVEAPARSMVEVIVRRQRVEGSLSPLLELHDVDTRWVQHAAAGVEEARLEWMVPEARPIPLMLHHAPNVGDACGPTLPRHGGPGYGYAIELRRRPFAPVELGALGSGGTLSRSAEALDRQGAMRIYRFEVPSMAPPTVEVTLAACPPALADRCRPIVVPIRPTADAVLYANPTRSVGADRTRDVQHWSVYRGVEHLFAVYDYDGRGAPGYLYDVRVTLE